MLAVSLVLCTAVWFMPGGDTTPSGLSVGKIQISIPMAVRPPVHDLQRLLTRGFEAGAVVRLLVTMTLAGFAGVTVARFVGMRFCKKLTSGLLTSIRHTGQRWRAVITSTWLTVALFLLAVMLCRFFVRMVNLPATCDECLVVGSVTWLTTAGTLLTLFVCGIGWLISLAAIGVDQCDGSEALSRGISYVLSRFWLTIVYLTVIVLIAGAGQAILMGLLQGVQRVAAEITGPAENGVADTVSASVTSISRALTFRNHFISVWTASLLFASQTVIYILLREAEDNVSIRETDGGALKSAVNSTRRDS